MLIVMNSPAQHSEDQVEHEEGSDDDERQEEDPVEHVAEGVVRLQGDVSTRQHIQAATRLKSPVSKFREMEWAKFHHFPKFCFRQAAILSIWTVATCPVEDRRPALHRHALKRGCLWLTLARRPVQ